MTFVYGFIPIKFDPIRQLLVFFSLTFFIIVFIIYFLVFFTSGSSDYLPEKKSLFFRLNLKSPSRKMLSGIPGIFLILLLFFAGFFIMATALSVIRVVDHTASPGLLISEIDKVKVLLITDPRLLRRGSWIAEGYLKESYAKNLRASSKGRLTIFGYGDTQELSSGRLVLFQGKASLSEKDNLFSFSAKNWEVGPWRNPFLKIRQRLMNHLIFSLRILKPDSASFLSALLLGRKTDLGSPLMLLYRESGCLHLLALSGFHVGLIAAALRALLLPWAGRHAATIFSTLIAIFFLLLIGLKPSLIRAVLMYIFWAIDDLRGRERQPWRYLSMALLVQSILNPRATGELSFRLSYAALAGIFGVGTAWGRLLSRYIPSSLSLAFGAGLGAQATTLPLVYHTFGLWRPIGLISSLFLTPATALAMALGTPLLFLGQVPFLGSLLVSSIDILLDGITWIATIFSRFSPLTFPFIYLPWLLAAIGTILPIIIIRRLSSGRKPYLEQQLPVLNPCPIIQPKTGYPKKMGPEFSY